MNLYKKITTYPKYIRGIKWEKHGDHADVKQGPILVDQIAFNIDTGQSEFLHVKEIAIDPAHGWLGESDNSREVHPGDYVICGPDGALMAIKADVFEKSFKFQECVDIEFEEIKS